MVNFSSSTTYYDSEKIRRFAHEYAEQNVDEGVQSGLEPRSIVIKRLELEYQSAVDMGHLRTPITQAVQLIMQEGINILGTDEWKILEQELKNFSEKMQKIQIDDASDESLQKLTGMSDQAMSEIARIARERYEKDDFDNSAALWIFLTQLKNNEPKYWKCLAMSWHELKKFTDAVKAYEAAINLGDTHVLNYLAAAECYFHLDMRNKGIEKFEQGKCLIEGQSVQNEWDGYVADLQTQFLDGYGRGGA